MSWIQLYHSELYDFSKSPEENMVYISIYSITHSLSLQCRFNGHLENFYSVAEHSYHVAKRVEELSNGNSHYVLYALLHDASESILCDIPRPIKRLPGAEWYRDLEKSIQEAIIDKFVPYIDNKEQAEKLTKQADLELLSTEKAQIIEEPPAGYWWQELPEPLNIKIEKWRSEKAKKMFLDLYFSKGGGSVLFSM